MPILPEGYHLDKILSPQAPTERVRFLADAMLGRLKKWLRLLGYDTAWAGNLSDAQVARWARAEGRILLTRDTALAHRRGLQVILLHSQQLPEQLREMQEQIVLPPAKLFSRCTVCNALLLPLSRAEAKSLVPPYVWRTQLQFRRCPRCGRVYWAGTHRQRVLSFLREIGWPVVVAVSTGMSGNEYFPANND